MHGYIRNNCSSKKSIDRFGFIVYTCFTETVKGCVSVKTSYSEMQYAQLAVDQFCRAINQVPFVSDVEIRIAGSQMEYGDYVVSVHFSDSDEIQKFVLEVKLNGEKRFANRFMVRASQYRKIMCYVFMAPYISPASAELLQSHGYSYMDLCGNCYILTRRIILSVTGRPNQYIERRREGKEYFLKSSVATSAVLRTMLSMPNQTWQVKSLAAASGKSLGTVANVKSFLLDRDWLKEENGMFHIQNVKELLYAWAEDYHKKDTLFYEFYSMDSIPEIEKRISEWSSSHDESALLGGFGAGARYAPTVRYHKISAYVEHQYLNEFVADMELQKVNSGGNVIVSIPHDPTLRIDYRTINGDIVTSPVQTVLDLLGDAGRGEEAANAIILKEFGER